MVCTTWWEEQQSLIAKMHGHKEAWFFGRAGDRRKHNEYSRGNCAKALKKWNSEETKRKSLADDECKEVSRGMRLEEKVEQDHVGPEGYWYKFDFILSASGSHWRISSRKDLIWFVFSNGECWLLCEFQYPLIIQYSFSHLKRKTIQR